MKVKGIENCKWREMGIGFGYEKREREWNFRVQTRAWFENFVLLTLENLTPKKIKNLEFSKITCV